MEGEVVREETTFCIGVIGVGMTCTSAGQREDLACLLV